VRSILRFGIILGVAGLAQSAAAANIAPPAPVPFPELGFLHLGFSSAKQADDGALTVDGVPFPGAGYQTERLTTPSFEAGFYLRGGFAVAVSGTAPITTTNIAAGTLTGYGDLGDETDGYYSLTGQYHLPLTSWIAPYVGAGYGYMQVFGTTDGVITNFKAQSAGGPVLQAGVDLTLTDHVGVFADVKRYFISTTATGNLGPDVVKAQARVDPWVISSGVSLTF
jgi:outer membrane protein